MKITLNNKSLDVAVAHRELPLVDYLREIVGLTGTKFGCGTGLCGACTVHLDSEAVRSCQVQVSDAENRHVTTIEGLAATYAAGPLHPVQQAWIAENVPQCGYCQPGQIMTASALLAQNPDPSEQKINQEMSGNLCRCGTYARIHKAIVRAAREKKNA
jgi:isoquinoline 1-oxidoreductase subunit alpha